MPLRFLFRRVSVQLLYASDYTLYHTGSKHFLWKKSCRGKVLKCSNCSYVYYCNRICQREAWPIHKTECLFLRKIAPRTVPDAARILSRIILKLNNGGEYEKGFYTDKGYRRFKDLMTRKSMLNVAANFILSSHASLTRLRRTESRWKATRAHRISGIGSSTTARK